MTAPTIERREPALVLVFSIITLGLYLPFWYHGMYEDMKPFFTNFVTSAIQQDQLNRIVDKLETRLAGDAGVAA